MLVKEQSPERNVVEAAFPFNYSMPRELADELGELALLVALRAFYEISNTGLGFDCVSHYFETTLPTSKMTFCLAASSCYDEEKWVPNIHIEWVYGHSASEILTAVLEAKKKSN